MLESAVKVSVAAAAAAKFKELWYDGTFQNFDKFSRGWDRWLRFQLTGVKKSDRHAVKCNLLLAHVAAWVRDTLATRMDKERAKFMELWECLEDGAAVDMPQRDNDALLALQLPRENGKVKLAPFPKWVN